MQKSLISRNRFRLILALIVIAIGLAAAHWFVQHQRNARLKQLNEEALRAPAPLSQWPWPHATRQTLSSGVTLQQDNSSPDGTRLSLFDFNFTANPNLRLELYDQGEYSLQPLADATDYWPNGVGQITHKLNTTGRGQVIAAWNGLFFNEEIGAGNGPHGIGRHVAPIVLNGQVYYNVGNHRWTFGVNYSGSRPHFQVIHMPDRAALSRNYTFASGGAQCLILNGEPLHLQPYPEKGEPDLPQPVPSTPADAGHIPVVDHIRTSRVSLAWSKDSDHLYLLFVDDSKTENAAIMSFRERIPLGGGWKVSDEQRFWLSFGAWGAINSDGGSLAQLDYLRPDGKYELFPPRWASNQLEQTVAPDFKNAPKGGSLMYFFVRDTSQPPRKTGKLGPVNTI